MAIKWIYIQLLSFQKPFYLAKMITMDYSPLLSSLRRVVKQMRPSNLEENTTVNIEARERKRELWRQIAASYVALTLYPHPTTTNSVA